MNFIFLIVVAVIAIIHWQITLGLVVLAIIIAILFRSLSNDSHMGKLERDNESGQVEIEILIKDNRTSARSARRPASSGRPKLTRKILDVDHAEITRDVHVMKPSMHTMAPTRGLVIMAQPLNQILAGEKTLELRGKHNRRLGPVALIKKGSGLVYGLADITESVGPMSFEEFRVRQDEHGVSNERLDEVFERGWVYGWRLGNIIRLGQPVPYVHKGMSQVNLDQMAIDEIQKQLDAA